MPVTAGTRPVPCFPPKLVRAAQPLPPPQPATERPQEVHLHLHGVTAEDIAAILARRETEADHD
jgi:hypothetical protein